MQVEQEPAEGAPSESEETAATPEGEDENPERRGPEGQPGPTDSPEEPAADGPSGPPPESIPGDSGQVPSPQQN